MTDECAKLSFSRSIFAMRFNNAPHPLPKGGKAVRPAHAFPQNGASLLIVLIVLVSASVLGTGAAQISILGARSARNDIEHQMAWHGAEAGLMDAELEILHGTRAEFFDAAKADSATSTAPFTAGCGAQNTNRRGLCQPATSGAPAWARADLQSDAGHYAEFGEFTGRDFKAGIEGIQPAHKPRYVIEIFQMPPSSEDTSGSKTIYRITSMGFGPRTEIQVVTQTSVIRHNPLNAPATFSRSGWRLIGNYSDLQRGATH